MKKASEIIQKVVASMIVFVMTMVNSAIVGFSAISYAVDMIATSNNNVQFRAYFETEEGEVTEIAKSIEEKTIKLKIDVAVQNEGYLSNGQISLQNAGFKIKEEQAENEYVEKIENGIIYLNQINAEEEAKLEIGIESIDDEEIEKTALARTTNVILDGKYYSNSGNENINGQSDVKITWNLPSNIEAKLATKLITNSTYKIEEQNKKIVQFLISSKIDDNKYPIKSTKIEVSIPEGATKVEAHKRTTRGTNGNKEFTQANYTSENNKLTINVENAETEGKISWAKNAQDIYVVTYEFPEMKDLSAENITVNSNITLYNSDATVLHGETQTISLTEQLDEIASIDKVERETEIYKGKIYTGQEREYTTYTRVYVDCAEAIKGLTIKDKESSFIKTTLDDTENETTEEKQANIQYKQIKLNKQNVENILGTEWEIKIKDQNNNEKTITNTTQVDENQLITVDLDAGAKTITITTSNVQNNGILEIQTTKAIIGTEYTRDEIKDYTKLKDKAEIIYTKNDNTTTTKTGEATIELKETKTEATLDIYQKTYTNSKTNENVEFVIKLNTNGEDLNLFKNPEIKFKLPQELKIKKINAVLSHKNGLDMSDDSIQVQKENNQDVIKIKITGEQQNYDTYGGPELHLYFNIDADSNIQETIQRQIEFSYTNEIDGTNKTQNYNVTIEATNEQEQETPPQEAQGQNETIAEGLEANIIAKRDSLYLNNNDSIFEGETVKYTITLKNTSGHDYNNINVKATQTNGSVWNLVETTLYNPGKEPVQEHFYKLTDSNELNFDKITNLKNGQSIKLEYEATSDKYVDNNSKTYGTIQITSDDGSINKTIKTIDTFLKQAEIKMTLQEATTRENIWRAGAYIELKLDVTNITNTTLNNVEARIISPKEVTYDEYDKESQYLNLEKYNGNVQLKSKTKTSDGGDILVFNISKLNANETISITDIPLLKEFQEKDKIIELIATGSTNTNTIYHSNVVSRNATRTDSILKIEQNAYINGNKIDSDTVVKDQEEIEFVLTIKNENDYDTEIGITDYLPLGAKMLTASIYRNGVEENKDNSIEENALSVRADLQSNSTIELRVKAKIDIDMLTKKTFENEATVTDTYNGQEFESSFEITTEKAKEDENPDNGSDDEGENGGSDKDGNYTIKGKAWLDQNKNGRKDDNEQAISGIPIRIANTETGTITDVKATTGENGEYSIKLQKGKYILVFMYDTNQYQLTTYKANGVDSSSNSDVLTSKIKENNKETIVGKTDEIDVKSNISNIDIGLINNDNFDFEIKKYVSKITVTNKEGTKEQHFDENTELPKVEIRGKYLSGSVVLVEYKIKVTNVGDEPGYVTSILDKIPSALKFESNINSEWYKKGNNLYNESLKNKKIQPGESKEVKLILTKTMTSSNTGLFKNTASIGKTKNENASNEKDITNNQSSIDIIITVSTGETVQFITITIALTIIITTGIGIVVKKQIDKTEGR